MGAPGTVVHAKVVVADDVVSFGTVNLDAWALYRNSEIMMIARSAEAAALFEERLFEPDIARSRRGEPPSEPASASRAGSGASSHPCSDGARSTAAARTVGARRGPVDDADVGFGHFVPGAREVAERLGDDDSRLVRQAGELFVLRVERRSAPFAC